MINTKVYLYSPSSLGSGSYTVTIYFQQSSNASYLNLGDVITDTAFNSYEITNATLPFSDGGSVTVHFITTDILPVEDTDYNSIFNTPGTFDPNPRLKTTGYLYEIALFDSLNYEYTCRFAPDDNATAQNALVGDKILDFNGKEFEITFLPPAKFTDVDPFRVKEVELEAKNPSEGNSTLYSSTVSYKFYQGSDFTDFARTAIQDRDFKKLDLLLTNIGQTGIQGVTGLGIQGETGIAGIDGQTGVQGETGIAGIDGQTGVQGVTGIAGIDGQTGVQGVTGKDGVTGVQGETGVAGIAGVTGVQGQTGIQGLKGNLTGATFYLHEEESDISGYDKLLRSPANDPIETSVAMASKDNSEVLIKSFVTETNDPSTTLLDGGNWNFVNYVKVDSFLGDTYLVIKVLKRASGGSETPLFEVISLSPIDETTVTKHEIETVQPDFFLDPTDRLVVQYYVRSNYTEDFISLTLYFEGTTHYSHIHTPIIAIGPQGATGVGTTGIQGIQGATGIQGVTGAGIQGVTGAQGPEGLQGPAGVTGLSGSGSTGIQGVTGAQGPEGLQGPAGVTGIQGNTGAGVGGVTGVQGPQGLQGPPGLTGIQGVTGAGIQGVTGAQGATGISESPTSEYDNGNAGTSKTINFNNGPTQKVTLDQTTCTFTFSNPVNGMVYLLKIPQTAACTVTWPGNVKWPGSSPTLSGSSKTDVFTFYYDGTSYWGSYSLGYTS